MKHFAIFLVLITAVLGSCASSPFSSNQSRSWTPGKRTKIKGTIRIVSVSAEKPGEWGALTKEVSDLMPLLFSEKAYLAVSPSQEADYSAEVTVRERDYVNGWKTKHSLSAEVRIWTGAWDGSDPLPLSAGRVLVQGTKSFSSSKTLSNMLRKATRNALRRLPRRNQRPDSVSGEEP